MTGRPVSEPKATTRISAPSSVRRLASTRAAIVSSAASSIASSSCWARLRRTVRRVEASGARTSVTRPDSKRSRRRSSSLSMSRGRRSEVSTSWAPAPWSALKVWKNSCSVRALLCEELDVVDEQDVDVAVRGLEGLDRAALERADELVGEGLGGRVEHGHPAAVVAHVVGDRVQQVGLAEPGRPADEQRVVGQPGHLGDGERGGVGEPVAVADDELVEREARVEGRAGARSPRPAAAARRRTGRTPSPGATSSKLDARAEHGLGARAQHAREAPADPGADRVGRLDDQHAGLERAGRERLQPDVPGGLADRVPQLAAGCGARRGGVRRRTRGRGAASSGREVGRSGVREAPEGAGRRQT